MTVLGIVVARRERTKRNGRRNKTMIGAPQFCVYTRALIKHRQVRTDASIDRSYGLPAAVYAVYIKHRLYIGILCS